MLCKTFKGAAVQPSAKLRASRPASFIKPFNIRNRRSVQARNWGKSVVDGWVDMSRLVSEGGSRAKTAYEDLASEIGSEVYVDVAGWHLYLRDMNAGAGLKMSQALAQGLGAQAGKTSKKDLEDFLKKVPVKLGAGKSTLSLHDVLPSMCVSDLEKILEDYAKNN